MSRLSTTPERRSKRPHDDQWSVTVQLDVPRVLHRGRHRSDEEWRASGLALLDLVIRAYRRADLADARCSPWGAAASAGRCASRRTRRSPAPSVWTSPPTSSRSSPRTPMIGASRAPPRRPRRSLQPQRAAARVVRGPAGGWRCLVRPHLTVLGVHPPRCARLPGDAGGGPAAGGRRGRAAVLAVRRPGDRPGAPCPVRARDSSAATKPATWR